MKKHARFILTAITAMAAISLAACSGAKDDLGATANATAADVPPAASASAGAAPSAGPTPTGPTPTDSTTALGELPKPPAIKGAPAASAAGAALQKAWVLKRLSPASKATPGQYTNTDYHAGAATAKKGRVLDASFYADSDDNLREALCAGGGAGDDVRHDTALQKYLDDCLRQALPAAALPTATAWLDGHDRATGTAVIDYQGDGYRLDLEYNSIWLRLSIIGSK